MRAAARRDVVVTHALLSRRRHHTCALFHTLPAHLHFTNPHPCAPLHYTHHTLQPPQHNTSHRRQTMPASAKANAFVNDKITTHKVVVFSKTYCPFCIKAKKALGQFLKPDQMECVELDNLPAGDNIIDIQDALGELTGARSVPRVFVGGKFIGGGDDTAAKAATGELKQLLAAAGVAL